MNEYIDAVRKYPQLLGLILGPTPNSVNVDAAPKQKESESASKLPSLTLSRRGVPSNRGSMLNADRADPVPQLLPMPHK